MDLEQKGQFISLHIGELLAPEEYMAVDRSSFAAARRLSTRAVGLQHLP